MEQAVTWHDNQHLERLLDRQVVLELDALIQSDKVFFIQALLLWIHHRRMVEGFREQFKHAILIEEAHHVLSGERRSLIGGQSVMEITFREIREFGEALVILDQHPSQISLPALGNTYTTICLTLKHSRDVNAIAARDGLHIFDVTDPSLPRPVAAYDQYHCNDVFVTGDLAYTATDYGLEVVDVTSPTAPLGRGKLWHGQASGVFVSDRLVYLAEPDYSGLGIIDVTNASSPTLIGSCRTSGRAQAATVSSDTAYLADWMGGLSIMDVTNPSSPTLRAVYDTLSDPSDVSVAEGVAYVANGVRGLKTIDVSNPRSPMVLGSLALPGVAAKITLSGKTAYVCDRSGTTPEEPRFLHIVDITTPSSPRLLSSYAVPRAWNGAVSGGLAYVTHNDGFQIIDVSNPSSPTLRGSFGTPGWPMDVAVSGELAFVADYTSLQIVDVSDPTSPFLRSSFEDGFRINEVFVSYGIAYITGTWAGGDFACLDVKNPDNPRLLGMYNVPGLSGEAEGLSVSKGFAYFLFAHLRILDVRDPSAPTLCGFYPTGGASGFPSDVFAYGDLVYLADLSGLRIFQYTGGAMGANHWPLYR